MEKNETISASGGVKLKTGAAVLAKWLDNMLKAAEDKTVKNHLGP